MKQNSPPSGEATDLFGDPWDAPAKARGRKAHIRNREVAEKVALLRATGSTIEDIALRVGLDAKTLRKYYSREVDNGLVLIGQVVDEAVYQKAKAGSVPAAKFLREQMGRGRAEQFERKPTERPSARAQPIGKKEAAAEDAKTAGAGTDWGDDLAFAIN